jgi:glycogen synthase kinase 3 beta
MLDAEFVMKVIGTYTTLENGSQYLSIIMDYYDCDLFNYIKNNGKKGLNTFDIKLITYQIFRGLNYIHSLGVCHRDIKPHNVLVKGKKAVICDFGSAKILTNEPNLPYICSRCYRAPELIFGATHYTTMIDIWSVGCVIL